MKFVLGMLAMTVLGACTLEQDPVAPVKLVCVTRIDTIYVNPSGAMVPTHTTTTCNQVVR